MRVDLPDCPVLHWRLCRTTTLGHTLRFFCCPCLCFSGGVHGVRIGGHPVRVPPPPWLCQPWKQRQGRPSPPCVVCKTGSDSNAHEVPRTQIGRGRPCVHMVPLVEQGASCFANTPPLSATDSSPPCFFPFS